MASQQLSSLPRQVGQPHTAPAPCARSRDAAFDKPCSLPSPVWLLKHAARRQSPRPLQLPCDRTSSQQRASPLTTALLSDLVSCSTVHPSCPACTLVALTTSLPPCPGHAKDNPSSLARPGPAKSFCTNEPNCTNQRTSFLNARQALYMADKLGQPQPQLPCRPCHFCLHQLMHFCSSPIPWISCIQCLIAQPI